MVKGKQKKPKPTLIAGCCAAAPPSTLEIKDGARATAVLRNGHFWKSTEPLRFEFYSRYAAWDPADQTVVRDAFAAWRTASNGGLDVQEAQAGERSHIRIACDPLRPPYSRLGTEAMDYPKQPTMNFREPLNSPAGRALALHEIGHALGFQHEHQNPTQGIEWNEQKVIAHFNSKNQWSETETRRQVLNKFSPADFDSRPWDPQSIMNYGFPPNLIKSPLKYAKNGLPAPTKLSQEDIARVQHFYAPLGQIMAKPPGVAVKASEFVPLNAFESIKLELQTDQEAAFLIKPDESRKYTIATVGEIDSSLTLYEQTGAGDVYLANDQDGGSERNAEIEARLIAGRSYVLRMRALYAASAGYAALMMY